MMFDLLLRPSLAVALILGTSSLTHAQRPGVPNQLGRGKQAANGRATNNQPPQGDQAGNAIVQRNLQGNMQLQAGNQRGASARNLAQMLIASHDLNGDGALDISELQSALVSLRNMMVGTMQNQQMNMVSGRQNTGMQRSLPEGPRPNTGRVEGNARGRAGGTARPRGGR